MKTNKKPVIGVLVGDPAGIGPELTAKLLDRKDLSRDANVLVIADQRLLAMGMKIAGITMDIPMIGEVEKADFTREGVYCLDYPTLPAEAVTLAQVSSRAGASVYNTLLYVLELAKKRRIDGFLFAPFNKAAMHLGGCPYDSEFLFFLDAFQKTGIHGEINVLDDLWTTRVTSHVAIKDVAGFIQSQRVYETITFLDRSLRKYGVGTPRIAVAGLNPHCGENGMFGKEEGDEIAPAIERAKAEGVDALGPYPPDTLFLRVEKERIDGIIAMYHDQSQIATKLLGFDRGVTIHGGLPIPIATPAHGTAFDIAGQNKANPNAICRAFDIVVRMAARQN